jgi:HSP20 family protein
MTMTRRPTDRNIMPFRTAMERLMGDWPFVQVDGGLTELVPPIDVRETDDAYVVDVDLPGIDPRNLELLIEGRTLTIRGEVSDEREEKVGNYLLRERRQGQFMRAVALPGMVDVDRVTSEFDNGQLTITLPKAVQNRARRIEIPSTNGATQSSKSNGSTKARASSQASQSSSTTQSGGQTQANDQSQANDRSQASSADSGDTKSQAGRR